jgi:predicted nucleic acid-binding Zn ribbon protein
MIRNRFSRRKPATASNVLSSTLKALRLDKKAEEYSAFPYWKEIVGEEMAAVAIPEKIIRGKILVIRVADAVYAHELSMQKNQLLDKLHCLKKGALFEDIRFVSGSPQQLTKKRSLDKVMTQSKIIK